jgi:hypothetical protein
MGNRGSASSWTLLAPPEVLTSWGKDDFEGAHDHGTKAGPELSTFTSSVIGA